MESSFEFTGSRLWLSCEGPWNLTYKSAQTPLPILNTPSYSGIRVPLGKVATIQVAMLPHQAPWRLQLSYHRESCSDSFLNNLKTLPEFLRAVTTRTPVRAEMHTIESDLIER